MEDEDWVVLSWVNRSKNKRQALLYLYRVSEPRTPKEISSQVDTALTHVSKALREMADNEPALVKVINPEAHYDRRYRITEKGRTIAEKIKALQEETEDKE